MEMQWICCECGREHNEPSNAMLGHRVACLDCAMTREAAAWRELAAPQLVVRCESGAPLEMRDMPPMAA